MFPTRDVERPPPADHLLRPRVLPGPPPRSDGVPDLQLGGDQEAHPRRVDALRADTPRATQSASRRVMSAAHPGVVVVGHGGETLCDPFGLRGLDAVAVAVDEVPPDDTLADRAPAEERSLVRCRRVREWCAGSSTASCPTGVVFHRAVDPRRSPVTPRSGWVASRCRSGRRRLGADLGQHQR